MDMQVVSDPAVERLTVLADSYADQIVSSMPYIMSPLQLREVLAGAFISYLAEAVELIGAPDGGV